MSGGVSWMGPAEAAEFERLTLAAHDDYDEDYTPESDPPCAWCGVPSTGVETPLTRSKVLYLCRDCGDDLAKAFAPEAP